MNAVLLMSIHADVHTIGSSDPSGGGGIGVVLKPMIFLNLKPFLTEI
jgi:hypothetical protein